MSAEQNPTTPPAGGHEPAEDRMTILERRLAEIKAQSGTTAPAAPDRTAIAPADALPIEKPAQGTEQLPAGAPAGSATAEASAADTLAAAHSHAPAPGTPEAQAAAETAQHVPDAVTVDGHDRSAPEARAVAHYGEGMASHMDEAPLPEPIASSAPAPLPDPENELSLPAAEPVPAAAAQMSDAMPAPLADTTILDATAEPAAAASLDAVAEGSQPVEKQPAETPVASLEAGLPLAAAPADTDEDDVEADEEGDEQMATAEADTADMPDFSGPDLPAQAAYLVHLIRRPDARRQRKTIMDLNRQYETNVGQARTAAREKFAEGGADAEAFAFQQPEGQQELNKALGEFRESRKAQAQAEDASRADNLTKKQGLLDQLRVLVEAAETKDSSGKLKNLQGEWKATGPVPQAESQTLWDTYHGLLDIYYSKQSLFHEMKDLDRRRNLEAKEALIARAEGLAAASGINKALSELTKLHEDWKAIGPVPNDQREPIWQRFIAASDVLHQRRKEFADVRSGEEKENLKVKQELLERVLPFAEFDSDRVNLWRSKTDELQEIKAEWEAAGLVPRKQADALNKQYWGAYKAFFNRKNEFFKSLDAEKNANVAAKQALIDQVEAALENPDVDEARNTIIRAQKEWKETGRVPNRLADKMWNRFRAAADGFFDRPRHETRQREEKVTQASTEQLAHLDQLAEKVNALSPENPATLEGFRELLAEWVRAFDPTEEEPNRATADRSEEQLVALLGKYLGQVPELSYADRNDLLFQVEVGRLKARPQAQQQLTRKEMAIRKEINELENDHATLQTNLDFFGRSKNAEQLRAEYQGRMDEAQQRITALKKQLKLIRS